MTLRSRIRKYLGLIELENKLDRAINIFPVLQRDINGMYAREDRNGAMLARIVSKVDPGFSRSDLDPRKRAESDRIAAEVLNRIAGEQAARDHTEGKR